MSKNTFEVMGTKYNFLDVGARGGLSVLFPHPAMSNDWDETYRSMFNFYGVEPDETEYVKLVKENQYHRVYSSAISNKQGTSDLYLTKSLGKSSLLKPNLELIEKHNKNIAVSLGCGPIDFSVQSIVEVKTTTVNELFADISFDVIKIDVQGLEYQVLEGAVDHLKNCSCLWIECSSIPLYHGQKIDLEIISFLKTFDFFPIYSHNSLVLDCEYDLIFLKEGMPLTSYFNNIFKNCTHPHPNLQNFYHAPTANPFINEP